VNPDGLPGDVFRESFEGEEMAEKKEKYFITPELQTETDSFKALLEASSEDDHILIVGPRGVGKSLFLQICMEHFKLKEDAVTFRNCAALTPNLVDNELFGHEKDAFTGASTDKKGFIETAEDTGYIILEEVNSLSLHLQAKLLVYMEKFFFYPVGSNKKTEPKIQIIATSNFEKGTELREDFRDRFKIVVDISPLHKRRSDIFYYIAVEYPNLKLTPIELLVMYSYNWPGNLRELDRTLFEIQAGVEPSIIRKYSSCLDFKDIVRILSVGGLPEDELKIINTALFGGILPFDYEDVIVNNHTRAITAIVSTKNSDPSHVSITIKNENEPYCIDAKVLTMFFAIVYGDSALTCDKPIWENSVFENTSKYLFYVNARTGIFTLPMRSAIDYGNPEWKLITMACKNAYRAKNIINILAKDGDTNCSTVNELTSSQIAKHLLSKNEHFPSLLRALAKEAKQTRISEITGVSTKTMSRWLKAARNHVWPPPKEERAK